MDEVNIRVEACEELRTGSDSSVELPAASFGKYGFVNKVIDGITATVNSVEITFHSREFESKVQVVLLLPNAPIKNLNIFALNSRYQEFEWNLVHQIGAELIFLELG